MIATSHMRHIFMPIDQTIKTEFISCSNLLNVTIQSHSSKRDYCKPNEKCWIVATINPISHSCPVHHSTFFNVLIDKFYSCKHREIIIFAHNYLKKTKQHFVLYYNKVYCSIEIRYFILLAINTHIDCASNSKFSVRCILKATARSLESVSFCIFCYLFLMLTWWQCQNTPSKPSPNQFDHSSWQKSI